MDAARRLFRRLNPWAKVETPEELKQRMKERMRAKEYLANEHDMTIEALASQLGTSLNSEDPLQSLGLTQEAASARLLAEGKNILSPPKSTPEIIKFLLHFTNFFMLLLLFAATLSCIVYGIDHTQTSSLYVGIFLFLVVVFDCTISYFQERASSNVMQTFSKMLPQRCKIVRDGHEREVGCEELVRGDLVKFGIGDKIPADLRIIFSAQAKVEASSITGESVPINLVADKTAERPTESRNLTFNGSLCLNGEAFGVVIRVGDNTLVGQIASLAGAQSSKPTTLQLEIFHLVKFIGILSFGTALIFFVVGMARKEPFLSTFVNGFIVVILAFLPCGLPTAVTSIISICAKKMAKKNVYVKKLDIVETLGSTSLIASDKTGTLTQNVMTVVSFWFSGEFVNVHSTGGPSSVVLMDLIEDATFKPVLMCASLCNRARYADDNAASNYGTPAHTEHEAEHEMHPVNSGADQKFITDKSHNDSFSTDIHKERVVLGDASDTAIFRFVNHLGLADRLRRQHRKMFEIPFNSTIKYSVVIVNNPVQLEDGETQRRHTLFLKGAPEIVLGRCTTFMQKNEILPITPEFTQSVTTAMRRSGAVGERVLAFAMQTLEEPQDFYLEDPPNFPSTGLTFLGLVSLVDPPRPNVPEAIKLLKKAHIKILMVTGDHPITAEAIARKVNIIGDGKTRSEIASMRGVTLEEVSLDDKDVQAIVVPGSELENYTDEQWNTVLSKREIVFARTTPTQKLEIVERNQALGYVVAVTGDGVNDSPALKAADVGVAMGKMGSDVAREAADIVLITDDFAAILDAVKMGRLIFDNLRKTIAYTLPHVLPEVIPVLCTLVFSLPLGLNSILILCIDLGTEMCPSVSIAYEKPESNIMARPPRDVKKDKMASPQILLYSYVLVGIAETLVCFFGFLLVFIQAGIPVNTLPETYNVYWMLGAPDFVVDGVHFTDVDQVNILNESATTYFMTMVLCQFWHVWFARTSRTSTFRWFPRNIVMILGVIVSLTLMVIIVYVPQLQLYLGSYPVKGINWSLSLIFLAYIMPLTETIKFLARRYKDGFVAKYIAY